MCYPSCWQQMIALTKDKRFEVENTVVFSIIIDPVEEWRKAIQEMPELNQAIVLFDIDKSVSKSFSMLTVPSSMHPGLYPGHSYVIIDKNGVVRYILDDPEMGIRNDFLLQEIKKINQPTN
jgi:peroxiredoxin